VSPEHVSKVLEEHKKWVQNDGGERAELRGQDLHMADLGKADLQGADLRGAALQDADLCKADLRQAILRRAILRWAILRWADLRWADLRGADLRWADLRGADLRRSDLRGADLHDADLRRADLSGANDAPLSLQLGPWLVYIKGGYMSIGCERHKVDDWREFSNKRIAAMDACALEFWQQHRNWLLAACEAQMSTIRETE